MAEPEMSSFFHDFKEKHQSGIANKNEEKLYKKLVNALTKLSLDPFYPGLHTHTFDRLSRRYGLKVWQSYMENNVSKARRIYWLYGPNQNEITIIGVEPHPGDNKNGSYERIKLSNMPPK